MKLLSVITLVSIIIGGFIINSNVNRVNAVCHGVPNTFGIWSQPPTLINTVTNGKLFYSGPENNTVPVVHLYGTPYQMGYAHGQLLKDQVQFIYSTYMEYFDTAASGFNVPEWAIKIIEHGGLALVLDLVYEAVKPYTPQRFLDELQGLADGSGVEYGEIIRFHMIPELVRASCSMFGAWGEATPNGGLLQLRALDWVTDSPLTLKPSVFVYHPVAGDGHEFTTLSWAGFIGSLTGYSGYTGVSEKVWSAYNGTYNRFGTPFYFVMRDILQYDSTVDEALNRISQTHRTCAIYMGVGSNASNTFTAVEYSYDYLRVFDDTTPFPIYAPQPSPHALIKNVVYIDPDYTSAKNQCMTNLLDKYYGDLTSENTQQLIALLQTGNLHAAIYDYSRNTFTVAVAAQNGTWPITSAAPAYTRSFIELDVTSLFNEELE